MTVRIEPEHNVSIDLAYLCENVSPPWSGVKRLVFLTLITAARLVVWVMPIETILRYDEYYSYQVLIGFSGHQLTIKTRSDYFLYGRLQRR